MCHRLLRERRSAIPIGRIAGAGKVEKSPPPNGFIGSCCLISRSSAKTTGAGANVGLIGELGSEAYQRNLLSILEGSPTRRTRTNS
jgi:hypothetical protein